jgi:hypothetical protein
MNSSSAVPNQEGTPTKSNPFANISFAAPTPSKAAFSFGSAPASEAAAPPKPLFGAPPSAVKPKAPSNGFNFGSDAVNKSVPFSFGGSQAPASSTAPKALFSTVPESKSAPKVTVPSFSTPPSSKVGTCSTKMKALNEGFFQWISEAWNAGHACADWSDAFAQYQDKVEAIEAAEFDEEVENASATEKTVTVENNTTKFSFGSSTPAPSSIDEAPKFSFGSSAPAPATQPATSFSFGNSSVSTSSAPPPAGFSSGFGSSAAKPSFSFGNIPPPSASTFNTGTVDDDDPTANPDDGKIEKVEQEDNKEEAILFEVRARPMKIVNNETKRYGTGVCRLYKHKVTLKHRLVVRNDIGKVQFNVAVSSKMTFNKEVKDGKNGKRAFVKFVGIEDANEGPKQLLFQVKPEDLDGFHSALVDINE